jgi:hypothetical protein
LRSIAPAVNVLPVDVSVSLKNAPVALTATAPVKAIKATLPRIFEIPSPFIVIVMYLLVVISDKQFS